MTPNPTSTAPVGVGRRLAAMLRALAALAVLLTCLVIAPLVMWRLIGWPLPHHVPSRADLSAALTRPLDQRLITGVLGCLFWYLYLLLALSTLTETITRATGRRRPRLPTAGLPQALTTALVGTILTGLVLAASRSKPAPTGPAAALAAWRTPTVTITAPAHPASTPLTAPDSAAQEEPGRSVPVQVHDSLWSLAAVHLGDPLRYRELFDLNHGRPQPDGDRLTRPDLIRPGWTLLLPADAPPAAPTTSGAPPTPPADPPPGAHPTSPPAPVPAAPSPPMIPWVPTLPDGPASTAPAPAPAAPTTASPTPATRPAHPAAPRDPIRLPSGPVLPASLLAAVAIAVTVARLLRHRTRPTGGRRDQPADPPLPLIIREILRSGHTLNDPDRDLEGSAPFHADPLCEDDPQLGDEEPALAGDEPPIPLGPPPYPDLDMPAAPGAPPVPVLVGPLPGGDGATATPPIPRPPRAGLRGPAAPTRLPTALRTGGGLSLPDPDAARALILTVLAAHHTPIGDDPHQLILDRDAADALHLPEQLLARLPHVTLTPSGLDAVASAEAHLFTRQRLADDYDAATIDELRATAPDEPLPVVLLVATADADLLPRLHALAAHGAALDILTTTLGPWPDHPRWPDPQAAHTDPAWALPADAATDLLDLLTQATPTDPPPADTLPSTTPSPETVTERPVGQRTAEPITPVDSAAPRDPAGKTGEKTNRAGAAEQASTAPDGTAPPPSPLPAETTTLPPADIPEQDPDGTPPAPTDPDAPGGEDTPPQPGPTEVRLILLDRPHLHHGGRSVYQGRLSLEIAGYLALHRTGATTTTLISALLPDADPDRARDQIYQAIRRLREAFRRAGAGQVLLSDRGGYQLASTLSCDLWDIEKALTAADRATDDDSRVAALRTATGLYTGRLLDGCEWATAHATHLEHRLIDAAADLADLLADTHPTDAAAILDHALTHHPYTESLYTHLMRLHAAAGHPADTHRVYRRLLTRLADLGATPSPATDTLLARLTRPPH